MTDQQLDEQGVICLAFLGTDRGFSGLRWEQAPVNSYFSLIVIRQAVRDTWIFASSFRGQTEGSWQNVSLLGESIKFLGYHQ